MVFNRNTTIGKYIDFFDNAKIQTVVSLLSHPIRLQINWDNKFLIVQLNDEVEWNGTDFVVVQRNYYKGLKGEAFQPYTIPIKAWPEWAERMWDRLPFDNYSICMHNMKYFVRFEWGHAEIDTYSWLVKTADGEIKLMSNSRFNDWRNQ